MGQKPGPPPDAIKEFVGNRIRLTIDRLVVEQQDESLRDFYKERIQGALNISNRYKMLLNNVVQLTIPELSTIAQILGVRTDDLIALADG